MRPARKSPHRQRAASVASWVEHLGKPGVQQRVHWRHWTGQVPIWLTIAGRIDMSYRCRRHVGVCQAGAPAAAKGAGQVVLQRAPGLSSLAWLQVQGWVLQSASSCAACCSPAMDPAISTLRWPARGVLPQTPAPASMTRLCFPGQLSECSHALTRVPSAGGLHHQVLRLPEADAAGQQTSCMQLLWLHQSLLGNCAADCLQQGMRQGPWKCGVDGVAVTAQHGCIMPSSAQPCPHNRCSPACSSIVQCSGTLIGKQHVLTAGHCVVDTDTGSVIANMQVSNTSNACMMPQWLHLC